MTSPDRSNSRVREIDVKACGARGDEGDELVLTRYSCVAVRHAPGFEEAGLEVQLGRHCARDAMAKPWVYTDLPGLVEHDRVAVVSQTNGRRGDRTVNRVQVAR